MSISKEIKKKNPKTLYQRTADEFKTSYQYVCAIACGGREPIRGKGLEIKKYLLEQIDKN